MTNERYIQRTQTKIESVLELYAKHIFQTVAVADKVLGMQTMEHLRKPPKVEEMQEMTISQLPIIQI